MKTNKTLIKETIKLCQLKEANLINTLVVNRKLIETLNQELKKY